MNMLALDTAFGKKGVIAKLMGSALAGLSGFFITEGDRRRAGIECAVREHPVKPPRADPKWHPAAKKWWRTLRADEGVTRYYEPSDWAYAALIAHLLSETHNMAGASSLLLDVVNAAMRSLLLDPTERVRLQVSTAPLEDQPAVSEGERYAQQLFQSLTGEEIVSAELLDD